MGSYQVKELDFLFIYEHKVRELENLCLLKYELDRRGYRTKIMHIEDAEALKAMRPIYHAKVVVMMACYQNLSIVWHTKRGAWSYLLDQYSYRHHALHTSCSTRRTKEIRTRLLAERGVHNE